MQCPVSDDIAFLVRSTTVAVVQRTENARRGLDP
jgi:hypothetical protein